MAAVLYFDGVANELAAALGVFFAVLAVVYTAPLVAVFVALGVVYAAPFAAVLALVAFVADVRALPSVAGALAAVAVAE